MVPNTVLTGVAGEAAAVQVTLAWKSGKVSLVFARLVYVSQMDLSAHSLVGLPEEIIE